MKPPPFRYHDPRSVSDAVGLLSRLENPKLLAGGQSLMPMMNFRYAMPDHVIDLNTVAELDTLKIDDHAIRAGAMRSAELVEPAAGTTSSKALSEMSQ